MLPCDADETTSSVLVRTETKRRQPVHHMGEAVSDMDDPAEPVGICGELRDTVEG